jgi:hypothetical protein
MVSGETLQGWLRSRTEQSPVTGTGAGSDQTGNGQAGTGKTVTVGCPENTGTTRNEAVQGTEQRRSRKDRKRSRPGIMSDSEGSDPTSASGVEQTRTSLQTEYLPGG